MHRHRGKKNLKGLAFSKRPAYVSRVTELGASNSERGSCPLRPGPRTNPWLGLGSPKQLSHPPGRWAGAPFATGSGGRAEAHAPLAPLHSPRRLSLSPLVMHPRPQTLVAR